MAGSQAYPVELRAKAIAAVAAGESMRSVARRLGLTQTTVARWVRTAPPIAGGSDEDEHATQLVAAFSHDEARIIRSPELMADLIYDTTWDVLQTLRVQLQVARDPAWLKDQSAADLARLLGTTSDRALRLLAGFTPTDGPGRGPASLDVVDATARPPDDRLGE